MEGKGTAFKDWTRRHSNDIFAYCALVFCILLFSILAPIIASVNILDTSGLAFKSIISDGVIYSILASGAVFVYALGNMDISVGAQLTLYSIILIRLYNVGGSNPLMIVLGMAIVVVIALLCGTINSIVAETLEMKSIITSLILQFFIYGICSILILQWVPGSVAMGFDAGTATKTDFAIFRNPWVEIIVLVVFTALVIYLFNFARLGRYVKAIGANPECAKQAGVNIAKYKLFAYLTFAVAIAVATLLFVANKGSTDQTAGKGYEMKIMISLILGGMPLSGGMKSKISAAIVGGFTYALISRCFIYLGVPDKYTTLFIALIYIVVVLITCRDKNKILPR